MGVTTASADSPWSSGVSDGRQTDSVNLVDGTTFAVSGRSGTIGEGATQGLYLLDTRVVSRWRVEVDGWELEPLAFVPSGPFSGTFVSRAVRGGEADSPIVVMQRRYVGRGMREDLEIRNHGPAHQLTVRLCVATDLAGLFAVKAGHTVGGPDLRAVASPEGLRFEAEGASAGLGNGIVGGVAGVIVRSGTPPDEVGAADGALSWHLTLAEGERWATCVEVAAVADGVEVPPSHPCGEPIEHTTPVGRLRRWREEAPRLASGDAALDRTISRSIDDLGSLRIFDPDHVDRVVVAAGAPWFMALFGRDSLLSSWMALPFGQQLAAGVLAELADNQGTRINRRTEEEPGRILHEVRFDALSAQLLGGANTYYGTADATPLFVMLGAELARWTGPTDAIEALLPAIDRALAWVDQFGDRDGDGFVEYLRTHDSGLEHQGWKDSWDGIRHADGSVAEPPIALCEVQGYVFAALRGRASLARAFGEGAEVAARYEERADDLRKRFDAAFWLDDVGWYAVGLDAAKRQITSLTSNIGHLLWTGIVLPERAERVAAHLRSSEMFTGWGLRTLAADAAGYNPLSYHCGSVWPHDTALAVAGLSRYGFDAEAQMVTRALIEAAAASGGRLPELFGGFARDDVEAPVRYPTSCSPQAWAAAAPMLLLRSMLGLEPDVAERRVRLRPRLPVEVGRLVLRGVLIGGRRIDIEAEGDHAHVSGTDLDVVVV